MFETGTRVGRYEIGQKIGQGGFGVLYAARDTELDRDVAIKILRPEHVFKPQVVQRFLQEARAAARIAHPGIVTVYESGQVAGTNTIADGTVYIAMELLAGDTLSTRIKAAGRLPSGIAIGMCRQMADALVAAHLAGIIHRDLKPQNIFLVRDTAVVGGERVKILDFGIAKLADGLGSGLQTHSLVMLGTPMYMSPEQCKSSAKVDGRSDVYSLGCILFEMLTGRTPFDGDSGELIAKHQLVAPPTARSIISDLPVELDMLVSAMLAKSPDERPQTMASVLDVLDAVEDQIAPGPDDITADKPALSQLGEPVTVASTARSRYTQLLRRRGPIAAAAAAAIVLGICGGVLATRDTPSPKPVAEATPVVPVPAPVAPPVVVVPVDAVVEPTVASPDEAAQLAIECKQIVIERSWNDCARCSEEVRAVCASEADNELALHRVLEAVKDNRLAAAKAALDDVPDTSVYRSDGVQLVAMIDHAPEQRPKTTTAATTKAAPPPARCDPEHAKDRGMENTNLGQHAAALLQFEASLRCQDDPYVRQLAFMSACSSHNSAKAKIYYEMLTPAQQTKIGPICERQNVAYKCDAARAKDEGMANINMGQHVAALASFEASLRCHDDPYVMQLAFMEACASSNSRKAKLYYKQLSSLQQAKFAQICNRQKPPVAYQ